jgi:hypothetical protein
MHRLCSAQGCPQAYPTFANVGVSVINHRTLSRLLVRLGRFLRDGPMRQHPLTILSIGKAATAS